MKQKIIFRWLKIGILLFMLPFSSQSFSAASQLQKKLQDCTCPTSCGSDEACDCCPNKCDMVCASDTNTCICKPPGHA